MVFWVLTLDYYTKFSFFRIFCCLPNQIEHLQHLSDKNQWVNDSIWLLGFWHDLLQNFSILKWSDGERSFEFICMMEKIVFITGQTLFFLWKNFKLQNLFYQIFWKICIKWFAKTFSLWSMLLCNVIDIINTIIWLAGYCLKCFQTAEQGVFWLVVPKIFPSYYTNLLQLFYYI